jgi:prevent-host-death family protein
VKKASIRDLHARTSELVREASEGTVIVIEKRGEPVAELHPIVKPKELTPEARARIYKEMEKLRASMPLAPESGRFIEEDRNR